MRERLFAPRASVTPIPVEFPLDWEMADSDDRNARMQLQGWTMLHPVMNVFDSMSDKRAAVEYLVDIARDWWSRYGDDPEDVVTSRTPESYAWYDMSVGYRALALTFFADRIRGHSLSLDPGDSDLLREVALKHARHLRNPEVLYPNNHGIFQVHGLRGIAEVYRYPEAGDDRRYAEQRLQELFEGQFDRNGVHREHSPHYHFYMCRTFESVLRSGWYEQSGLDARLSLAEAVRPWLVDPQRRLAAVGDSLPKVQRDVVFPSEGSPAHASQGLILSPFDDSGYAVARSPWGEPSSSASYLFFTAAYHSKSHKHRDCLSFEWYERGSKRVTDSGKYGYWADDMRRYMLSSRAHNSLDIEGFDILRMSPYGSAIKAAEMLESGQYHVRGELRFKALTHFRDLYYLPGRWIVVVDHVESARPRQMTQWFHVALGHAPVNTRNRWWKSDGSGRRRVFTGPDKVQLVIHNVEPGVDASVVCGQENPHQGFVSLDDDHAEPGYALGFRTVGSEVRLVTVLAMGAEEEAEALSFIADSEGLGGPQDRVQADGSIPSDE